ncbi:MAG: hypothetical protein R3C09_18710 [Pirellulaceae bacterium]
MTIKTLLPSVPAALTWVATCRAVTSASSKWSDAALYLTTFDLTRHGIVVAGHATERLPQIILEIDGDQIYATGIVGLLYGYHQSNRRDPMMADKNNISPIVPLPPTDAKVHTTACDYCVVGCGYKKSTLGRWALRAAPRRMRTRHGHGLSHLRFQAQWVSPNAPASVWWFVKNITWL